MRTLKNTLCLVLCLAMMVGLCAFGVHADFTDEEEIVNKEAVDLMAGLGIIEGYTDGSYQPSKIFNRAEACKIISYLLLGKDGAEALPASAPFDDVPASHWAAGFIAYAKSQGIVEGVGNNKFNPTGELTAAAWGKMLLCALGYKQDIEGMTGSQWDFNVTRLISKTKLADGMAFAADTPMSRDNAALLAFNALVVPKVEYNGGTSVETSDGTTVTVNATLQTVPGPEYLADNFNLAVDQWSAGGYAKDELDGGTSVRTGVITANSSNDDTEKTTLAAVSAIYTTDVAGTYAIDTGADLLGHYVQIYTSRDGKTVYSLVDLSKEIEVAKAITTAANYQKAFGKTAPTNPGAVAFGSAPLANNLTTNADAGKYILNDKNEIVATVKADFIDITLDKVTAIVTDEGKETITFAGAGPVDNGNNDNDFVREYDGIAKDDYVIITLVDNTIYNVAKAEIVEGAISKVGTDDFTITLDGTAYPAFDDTGAAAANFAGVTVTIPANAAAMKDTTYRLYLDGEGNWYACELVAGVATTSAAMVVTGKYQKTVAGDKGDVVSYFVQAVDATGAEQSFQVNATDYAAVTAPYAVYTFTEKADGTNTPNLVVQDAAATTIDGTNVTEAWDTATAVKLATTDKTVTTTTGAKTAYLNADTKYIFIKGLVDDGAGNLDPANAGKIKYETKTGGVNFADAALATAVYLYSWDNAKDQNLIVKAVFIGAAYADAGVAADQLLYFTKDPTACQSATTATGFTYTVYNAATGAKTEITTKTALTVTDAGYYKYTKSGDLVTIAAGDYMNAADTAHGLGTVMYNAVYGGKIDNSIHIGANDYAVTSDTIFVDVRASKAYTGTVTTLAGLAAAYDAGKTITFDASYSKTGLTVIFIKSVA